MRFVRKERMLQELPAISRDSKCPILIPREDGPLSCSVCIAIEIEVLANVIGIQRNRTQGKVVEQLSHIKEIKYRGTSRFLRR